MNRWPNTRQPDWDWWSELWPDPAGTLRQLGFEANVAVADVGCGNGYFTLPAARLVASAMVYAIDLDGELLAELESKATSADIRNLLTIEGDARALDDLLPEPVDTVLVANTFHGIEDSTTFARTAARSLTPGGRLVVVNWHARPRETTTVSGAPRGPPTVRRISPEATAKAVTGAGFVTVETADLPPYHYGLVFERS